MAPNYDEEDDELVTDDEEEVSGSEEEEEVVVPKKRGGKKWKVRVIGQKATSGSTSISPVFYACMRCYRIPTSQSVP